MISTLERVCVELTRLGWPDAVDALLRSQPDALAGHQHLNQAKRLSSLACRVLALDAEDFGELATQYAHYSWSDELVAASFPAEPRAAERGALGSLVPLFELMLEICQIRTMRGETQDLVVTLHLMAEYVAQLAWEPVLGHGGDPLRLGEFVGGRFGSNDTSCPHSSAMRATARRALNACHGDVPGYVRYLDKFHSRLGDAMAECAMNHETISAGERPDVADTCPRPCSWVLDWGTLEQRRALDARLRLALIFVESPVIALRHHAPVGHFFGVPSVAEISDGWLRTWQRLTQQWSDGSNPLVGRTSDDTEEALPGLALLMSTIADQPIRTGTLLRRIGGDLIAELERD